MLGLGCKDDGGGGSDCKDDGGSGSDCKTVGGDKNVDDDKDDNGENGSWEVVGEWVNDDGLMAGAPVDTFWASS